MVHLPYILVNFYRHHQDIYMSAYLSFFKNSTVFIYSLKVLYIFRMYICYMYHWISPSYSSQDPQSHISPTFMSSFIIAVLSLSPISVGHTWIGIGPSYSNLGHGKTISSHIPKEKWLALFSIQELLVIAQTGMRIPWLPWSYEAFAQATTGGKLMCASDMWYPEESMSQISFYPAALPFFLTLLPWCSLSLEVKVCSRGGILCLVLYSSQKTTSGEAIDPSQKPTCVVLIGHVVKLLSKCLC